MKIKDIKLLPLEGKYYGSTIRIEFEDKQSDCDIKIWYSGNFIPSDRELKDAGITREEYLTNILNKPQEDGWGDITTKTSDLIEFDNHTETQDCLEICNMIVNALKEYVGILKGG